MHALTRFLWFGVVWLAFGSSGAAGQSLEEEWKPFVPLRPQTREDLARREARKLYGLGLLREHEDRLIEATHAFEDALHLDPEAISILKALIPLYVALGRSEDALTTCQQTLALDPGDFETWSLYARQLRTLARPKEARAALVHALACPGLADHVDLRLQLSSDLGSLCEEAQDYDQAVMAFREVVRILDDPQTELDLADTNHTDLGKEASSTLEHMIQLCIQARRYDRALQIFAEARAKHPDLARRLNYHLAKVYVAQGEPAKALGHLDEYLQTQPQGAEAYELRSTILEQLGRAEEILPALEKFAERDGFNHALRLLLARQYGQAGQTASAEKVYQALAEQSPTAEIYRGLFTLYRQMRATDRAVGLLDEALSKADRSSNPPAGDSQAAAKARAMLTALREDAELTRSLLPAAHTALLAGRELHPQMRYFLAVLAARVQQLEQAEYFYRRCLEGRAADRQHEAAVYAGLIRVLWTARKYDAVVEICRRGLSQAQATNHLLFRQYLSRALVNLGKVDEAIAEADRAVEIANDETRFDIQLNRISVLTQAERYDQAIALAQTLAKEFGQPEQVRALRDSLHNVYTAMRDFAKAEEQLRLILQADPNDATANNNLGYLWADQGKNLEEAERLIRKAIELDRQQKRIGSAVTIEGDADNAAFVDSLGWVLFRRGKLEEARTWLEKATELTRGEDDPTVWDHLGDVYFRQQKIDDARRVWRKSLVLYEAEKRRRTDEHYKELKHKLELLDSEAHPP
ncbi:MAG TPA: tetratricopeptide repeat protein [Gemmataceae bacterium]|nr:tetratricopeptide repeat protein [Gemmataceae bacterium]